jgi:hypothetical protein
MLLTVVRHNPRAVAAAALMHAGKWQGPRALPHHWPGKSL